MSAPAIRPVTPYDLSSFLIMTQGRFRNYGNAWHNQRTFKLDGGYFVDFIGSHYFGDFLGSRFSYNAQLLW